MILKEHLITLIALILIFVIANIFLKTIERIYTFKSLNTQIHNKDTYIAILQQFMTTEDINIAIDIYRIKTDPDRWLNYSPQFIKLALEHNIYLDHKFDSLVVSWIESNYEAVKDLPGTGRYSRYLDNK